MSIALTSTMDFVYVSKVNSFILSAWRGANPNAPWLPLARGGFLLFSARLPSTHYSAPSVSICYSTSWREKRSMSPSSLRRRSYFSRGDKVAEQFSYLAATYVLASRSTDSKIGSFFETVRRHLRYRPRFKILLESRQG